MVEAAQWVDAGNAAVHATIDGVYWQHISMDEQSHLQRQVQDWIDAGGVPDPYVPPPPTPPDPAPETTVLYDHENRLRAIEGQPPLTLMDFFAEMKRP